MRKAGAAAATAAASAAAETTSASMGGEGGLSAQQKCAFSNTQASGDAMEERGGEIGQQMSELRAAI